MMQLVPVPHAGLSQAWPMVLADIEAACGKSEGDLTPRLVAERLNEGVWTLCIAFAQGDKPYRGAVVLGAEVQPEGRKLFRVVLVGGDAQAWPGLLSEIEDMARVEGCARVVTTCRKGWAKRLKDYRLTRIELVKEL